MGQRGLQTTSPPRGEWTLDELRAINHRILSFSSASLGLQWRDCGSIRPAGREVDAAGFGGGVERLVRLLETKRELTQKELHGLKLKQPLKLNDFVSVGASFFKPVSRARVNRCSSAPTLAAIHIWLNPQSPTRSIHTNEHTASAALFSSIIPHTRCPPWLQHLPPRLGMHESFILSPRPRQAREPHHTPALTRLSPATRSLPPNLSLPLPPLSDGCDWRSVRCLGRASSCA